MGAKRKVPTEASLPIGLGDVFADAAVARLYERRPPYPDGVLVAIAHRLVAPHSVLDAGAGTGSLARRMAAFAARIDAVERSAAMIAEGQRLPGGTDPRVRWIHGRAGDALLAPPYGLIVCGESLHWMTLDLVLPRFRAALAPGAYLAIIGNASVHGPYREEVWAVLDRFAAVPRHPETADAIAGVRASGLFTIEGEERTDPMPFEQSVDEYIEFLHSTSVLTRAQLGDRAGAFATAVRAVFARHGMDRLRYQVVGTVTWAAPRRTERKGPPRRGWNDPLLLGQRERWPAGSVRRRGQHLDPQRSTDPRPMASLTRERDAAPDRLRRPAK